MKNQKRIPLLCALGLILTLAGLAGLYSGPQTSQYVFPPATVDAKEILTRAEESLGGAFAAVSLHGVSEGITVETEQRSQGEITLYQIAGDWRGVYPQQEKAGRFLSRGDQEAGSRVIVLDEATAFKLFGDEDAIGQQVKIGEKVFETVGVAAHARRIGETGAFAAWIPLGLEGAPACGMLVFSAAGKSSAALRTVFDVTAKELAGEGQALHLDKERQRRTIVLRVLGLIFGIRLLSAWLRMASDRSRRWAEEIRERARVRYFRQMAGFFLVRALGMALLFGCAVGIGAGLAAMAVQPMQVFPEWVPEILVDPASVAQRFWDLTSAAAAPRQWQTPEMAEIRFWGGMIRWGVILFLVGGWGRIGRGKAKTAGEKTGSLGVRG